jgi:hypothetical protein
MPCNNDWEGKKKEKDKVLNGYILCIEIVFLTHNLHDIVPLPVLDDVQSPERFFVFVPVGHVACSGSPNG